MKIIKTESSCPFEIYVFNTRDEWLEERKKHIGGSELSAICGLNPYKTIIDLWKEKTGLKKAEDISNISYIKYGSEAEAPLRKLFALNYSEDFDVINPNEEKITMWVSKQYPFLAYTPDGELVRKQDGERGIYEGKTTKIVSSMSKEKWNDKVPLNYYCQLLEGFLVSDYSFAVLNADMEFVNSKGNKTFTRRTYLFEKEDCLEDLKWALDKAIEFWKHVENGTTPSLTVNITL